MLTWRRGPSPVVAAVVGLLSTACREGGPAAPRDPGTVRVAVHDEAARPVLGAVVSVEMPNNSGGVFEVGVSTRADGIAIITGVPAGARRVTVTAPMGYAPSPERLVRVVDVIKAQTVQVSFVLRRGTSAN